MKNEVTSTVKDHKDSFKGGHGQRTATNRTKVPALRIHKRNNKEKEIIGNRNSGLQSGQSVLRLDHLTFVPKTYAEVLYNIGTCFCDYNIKTILHDIYLCCKRQNKAITEHNFSKTDTIKDVIIYIEELLLKTLGKNNQYSIVKVENGPKASKMIEYNIHQYKVYDTIMEGHCIELKFLDELKDQKLRECLIATFAYITDKIQCKFLGVDDEITEHYAYDIMLDNAENWDGTAEEKELFLKNIEEYHSGKIRILWDSIRKKKIKERNHLNLLIKDNPLFNDLNKWILNITDFLEKEYHNIQKFDYNIEDPDHDNGRPVYYSDTIGFYYDEDYVYSEINQYYEAAANEEGIIQATELCIWTPTKIKNTLINSNWPVELQWFFRQFIQVIQPKIEKL